MRRSRPRGILPSLLLLSTAALPLDRTSDPGGATVFIRVIGSVEMEVDSTWTESRAERNVELATGTGFVFTPYGHVLTNHHVVAGGASNRRGGRQEVEIEQTVEQVEVVLPPSAGDPAGAPLRLAATVEVSDPELDLAVLSVSGAELPYLALGDSDAAEPGEGVSVYGYPFGSALELGKSDASGVAPAVSVSRGAVAAARVDDAGGTAYLQTSAVVNPGNSGGPMVDSEGFVVGVVRLKLQGGDGVGFAIPVNLVKDFLESHGYGDLLPVERLRLSGDETLPGKGLTLRLPSSMEDRSPTKLSAFSDPAETSIGFASDRVATAWELGRLEELLLSGGAFGSFRATEARKSAVFAAGRLIMGRATGLDGAERESKVEYALFENGLEKVVVRYTGTAESVAFNRSVLLESLASLRVTPLLTEPIAAPVPLDAIRLAPRPLPLPGAPSVLVPEGWEVEAGAPLPCQGLPAFDSAIAASPPGDFTVSLRAAWWRAAPAAAEASRGCGEPARNPGDGTYGYRVAFLGEAYAVAGAFGDGEEGLLQLEVVAPVSKEAFVSELRAFWMERNRRR